MKYTLLLVAFATLQPALDATIASAYTIYPDCGGPCPQHVFRTPTPNELVGLDNQAFYDYAVANGVNPDVIDAPFQWTVIDSNANGWVIGYHTGPSFWDGSFVFHAGVGVVCCMMDELTLKMINSNNMVSGTNPGGTVFFNVSDLFGASEFFDPAVNYPDGRPFDGLISALGILNALDDGRIILRDGEMLVPIPSSAATSYWTGKWAASDHCQHSTSHGDIAQYFPGTGGRWDIGPATHVHALALFAPLGMRSVALGESECSMNIPFHMLDTRTGNALYCSFSCMGANATAQAFGCYPSPIFPRYVKWLRPHRPPKLPGFQDSTHSFPKGLSVSGLQNKL